MSSLSKKLKDVLTPLFDEAADVVQMREHGGLACGEEAWFDEPDKAEAMKRLWAGALVSLLNTEGAGFGYVPFTGSFVRHKGEFEVRLITDGSESGTWYTKDDLPLASFWPGAMLPVGDERRRISPEIGDTAILFKPVPSEGDAMTHVYGSTEGAPAKSLPVSEWATMTGHPLHEL
jgi:hypothetical protein